MLEEKVLKAGGKQNTGSCSESLRMTQKCEYGALWAAIPTHSATLAKVNQEDVFSWPLVDLRG